MKGVRTPQAIVFGIVYVRTLNDRNYFHRTPILFVPILSLYRPATAIRSETRWDRTDGRQKWADVGQGHPEVERLHRGGDAGPRQVLPPRVQEEDGCAEALRERPDREGEGGHRQDAAGAGVGSGETLLRPELMWTKTITKTTFNVNGFQRKRFSAKTVFNANGFNKNSKTVFQRKWLSTKTFSTKKGCNENGF